jgi:hypothetical protein
MAIVEGQERNKERGSIMSAPDTNIEKQKRRHWPALVGIAAALIFGGIVALSILGTAVEAPPEDASEINQIDGAPTTTEPATTEDEAQTAE